MMDVVNEPHIETVVIKTSAQVGKTELILNVIGYYIDYDPSPILVLQPNTKPMGEAFSKDRLAPMLRDTPALKGTVKDAKARDSGNTLLHKTFPGGHVTISGANSPASLASRPIRIFLADEVNRYPASAGTEGDPLKLGGKRTTTFFNRKKIYTSTPTVKNASRIDDAYDKSDQRQYHVPCKHCGEKSVLKWANVKWDKDENGEHLPETAFMVCEHCGGMNHDHEKIQLMLQGGEWIAQKPGGKTAGFHLNELYSPWKKWSEVVEDFLDSKDDSEQLKTWTNTSLGESFEETGDQVDNNSLYNRREEYPAQVPDGAVLLTMGADIQADRIEAEITGWGEGEQSWNVDYKIFYGDTTQADVWDEFLQSFDSEYEHETGNTLKIAATGIDSGYQTQLVYDFVEANSHRRVFALKGVEGAGRAIISQSRPNKKNKNSQRKVDLFIVGVDDAKLLLSGRLNQTKIGPGYCHFPMDRDDEYFAQLTAEKMITKYRRGFPIREWVKTRTRNEACDCRIYSHAVLKLLNPDWDALRRRLEPEDQPVVVQKQPTVTQQHRQRLTRPARKGGFVNRW